MADFIFRSYEDGKSLDIQIVWLSESPDPDMMIKLRWNLWSLMSIYCQEQKIDLKEETEKLRAKYHVQSRTEMNRSQLEEAIETYKAGLKYNW